MRGFIYYVNAFISYEAGRSKVRSSTKMEMTCIGYTETDAKNRLIMNPQKVHYRMSKHYGKIRKIAIDSIEILKRMGKINYEINKKGTERMEKIESDTGEFVIYISNPEPKIWNGYYCRVLPELEAESLFIGENAVPRNYDPIEVLDHHSTTLEASIKRWAYSKLGIKNQ